MELEFNFETNEMLTELNLEEKFFKIVTSIISQERPEFNQVSLSVSFVTEDEIQAINKKWRQINKVTDVISFAYLDDKEEIINNEVPVDLGEIIISPDVAKIQADFYKHPLERELAFLLIHGLLHLLSYDHLKEPDATQMFELQNHYLLSLYDGKEPNK